MVIYEVQHSRGPFFIVLFLLVVNYRSVKFFNRIMYEVVLISWWNSSLRENYTHFVRRFYTRRGHCQCFPFGGLIHSPS